MNSIKITFAVAIFITAISCKKSGSSYTTDIEIPVGVFEVGTSSIEEFINTTGTALPLQEAELVSEMSGKYKLQTNPNTGVPYALGDFVAEGAIIIKLEDAEYYNDLRIKSKEINLEISKQEHGKQKSLYQKGGATLRELKNAEISEINAEYDIESSRLNLAKMSVKAPFSGVISELPYFTRGTKVNTNEVLVKLINYSKLYIESNLPEKYYANVRKGLKVYITSYTNPGDTLIGKITQIAPFIDPEARTFKNFIVIDNKYNKLLPGMFVKADLVVNSSDSTITIPKEIITSRNRRRSVFVVNKGIVEERRLSTGLESDEMIEILSGLEIGESVVNKGYETLRHKSKVKVVL